MTGIIETDRLILRTPKPSDVERIAAIADNWRIASMLGLMPHPFTQRDAMDFIVRVASLPADAAQFAITLKDEDGMLIGGAGYGPAHRLPEGYGAETDFGYWLGENYWGKGYASEAAAAVRDHAFTHTGIELLSTDYNLQNAGSKRVLEKLGFEPVGQRTRYSLAQGADMNTMNMHLPRSRWQAMKDRAA
jgi:RimJ/RimL family protein N-acetyltransferase